MTALPWEEWGKAAFDRAAAEEKPILLSLSSPYPEACQIMDRDAWSDAEIAGIAKDHYVPVRVIADLRPDIFDRYMAGGLPSTVFLTPRGQLLWGGTFMPPHDLKTALARLHVGYATNKERLAEAIQERDARINQVREGQYEGKVELTDEILAKTVEGIVITHDEHNGGFGGAPKAPLPASLEVLRVAVERSLHPEAMTLLNRTLDAIAKGLYDPVDGGFFPIARTEHWTHPETEKLLVDQAALIRIFADCGEVLKAPRYLDIAKHSVDYVLRVLKTRAGQIADPGYYVLDAAARRARATPAVPDLERIDAAAMMSATLLRGAAKVEALRTIDRLASINRGEGLRLLRDAVALAAARAAASPGWTAEKAAAADWMAKTFRDPETGGLLDREPGVDELGELSFHRRPLEENARAARILAGMGRKDEARKILESFPDFGIDYGHMTAEYALAVDAMLHG